MNAGYEYNRWYKLTLSSKKTITVTFKDLCSNYVSKYPNFTVYNASGEEIDCPFLSGTNYRTAKVAKGTYYIRVYYEGSYAKSQTYNRLYTIKWK